MRRQCDRLHLGAGNWQRVDLGGLGQDSWKIDDHDRAGACDTFDNGSCSKQSRALANALQPESARIDGCRIESFPPVADHEAHPSTMLDELDPSALGAAVALNVCQYFLSRAEDCRLDGGGQAAEMRTIDEFDVGHD